jgi:NADP-dependent 3-hydroxy acid dehydrogenase YdfG
MLQHKQGVIITITSTARSKYYECTSVYGASKAAAHSITMTAAKELSPFGKVSILFFHATLFIPHIWIY